MPHKCITIGTNFSKTRKNVDERSGVERTIVTNCSMVESSESQNQICSIRNYFFKHSLFSNLFSWNISYKYVSFAKKNKSGGRR